ncbi:MULTISPECIES: PspA/IM30 family protein [Clostridium]|jgi:Phage shock protein A (IM30), suppresses sigma54-dependent transcription|uniref:Phage shock protein A n=4 Tax=Clostridium TaxID=1485 RepID=A0A0B5Q4V2_CLOBE|nr:MULTISPECIES: PspA/IM30 family protein [Clostridium]ABR32670.1 phage shock protein A, PspA [Clostridium beijerinckii NCIMB 8052]AIU03388.1 phage shock protein A, PspA [Clostridium beijerinckii ATCC 35702]AJG97189.1 phage shock protein A [Clostridium beijerinckii]ALB48168.1 PspA/IM30 family protein [Clostridium beijerinckii NRRL B-598]AVK49584.1 phage shock protein A [Clostridium sp. MF28]
MGIFSRMSNMIKAKVNNSLDEMENPVELLDQKLRDMDEQFNKAKLSSAQILGNVHEIEKKLDSAKKESEDYDQKVRLALSKGNEELAKRALAKKVETDKKAASLQASYDNAKIQADTLKANLRALEEEITKTRSYRDEAAARFANAEASQKVNEVLANVQTKNNSIQIDSIERKIQRKESLAQGLGELRDLDDFDSEFKKLDEVDLDLELAKYKSN